MSDKQKNRFSSYCDASEMTLYSLFMKYDENSDGMLSEEELMLLLKTEMALTTDEIEVYFFLMDKDGDTTISFEEFKAWYESEESLKTVRDQSRYHIIKSAIELFKRFDTDGSLALDREELQNVIAEFGGNPELVDGAMQQVDVDGNGRISFREFLKWLNWVPDNDLF